METARSFQPVLQTAGEGSEALPQGPELSCCRRLPEPGAGDGGDDAAVGRDLSLGADTACDAGARALGAMWVLGSAGERSKRVRGSAWHSPHFPLSGSAPEG